MDERNCWNCGHSHGLHTIDGGCSATREGERCDCRRYEDGEYLGEQRKRDLYTNSDTRKAGGRRNGRR